MAAAVDWLARRWGAPLTRLEVWDRREGRRGGGWDAKPGRRGAKALSWARETPWREDDLIGWSSARGRSSEDAGERWPPWGAQDFQQGDCGLKHKHIHERISTSETCFPLTTSITVVWEHVSIIWVLLVSEEGNDAGQKAQKHRLGCRDTEIKLKLLPV